VISTKNAIISIFNLIVLYILVAFYLIYIGMTYIGISYVVLYVGAIAILFLFIIMIIDIEVVEKRNNNNLPLLFLLLSVFLITFKKILFDIGLVKIKSFTINNEKVLLDNTNEQLFYINSFDTNNFNKQIDNKINNYFSNIYKDPIEEEINIKLLDSNLINEENIKNFNVDDNSINYHKSNIFEFINYQENKENNYLLVVPDWNLAVNKITQITGIGDILYTVYHSYIYILSIILLLGMIGAIILTKENTQEIRMINVLRNKESNIISMNYLKDIYNWLIVKIRLSNIKINKNNNYIYFIYLNKINMIIKNIYFILLYNYINIINNINNNYLNKFKYKKHQIFKGIILKRSILIPSFFNTFNIDNIHSETILGNLSYFIIASIFIGILLLGINTYFSLSIKYLEKGGGFECGFTSFFQTRERFNVIFYRVSLLFLIFDLEIILAFPYTAIYQKNQNMSKNNVLIFLYILIVGFIYELKEGALNIVKKAHKDEIN
jgi:NADH:ubiquinone oxidoreductase subunit 3 (subunit A)/NADH:ubiquinone oxidoreductase subunit 6 (subunit J)